MNKVKRNVATGDLTILEIDEREFMRHLILCAMIIVTLPLPCMAGVHRVNSGDAIIDLIESGGLAAGDEIIWANGVYKDQEIELNGVNGTKAAPITLRAEKPGGVVLIGESQIRTNAKWWVIEGFHFDGKDDAPASYNPVQFRGSGNVGAEHVRLTNCAFTKLDNKETTAKWIQIYGRFNQIDHCHFSGKPNKGALITVELGDLEAEQSAEHVIKWNYFADVAKNEGSDNETIRVGFSGEQNRPARCVVEHNLFFRCDGENEIISNKSSYNRYTANTFRKCNGSLVLRHGHHATVNGNFFLGDGAKDAGGLRINDSHHRIFNNYMQDLTGTTWNAALSIEGGKKPSGGDSNGYQAVDNVMIAHNSIINCAKSIFLNPKHGKRSPTGVVANNLVFVDDAKKTLVDASLPTDGLNWSQNLFFGAELAPKLPGLQKDPQLVAANGRFVPAKTSPVVDAAKGEFDFVSSDVDNQPRPANAKDIGADEFDADKKRKPAALTRKQVGTTFLDRVKESSSTK